MVMAETQRSPESCCDPSGVDTPHGSARTPPPAFPFLRITMSKSRSDPKAMPRARTPDGSKSPIRSQRQPQSSETNSDLDPLLSEGSRGRVWSRRKWERPARRGDLSAAPSLVKGPVTVSSPYFLGGCDLEATILPECVVTLDIVKGEVTIPGVRGGSRELAEWGISETAKTLKSRPKTLLRSAAREPGSRASRGKITSIGGNSCLV